MHTSTRGTWPAYAANTSTCTWNHQEPVTDMDVVLSLEDGRDRLKRFHFAPGPARTGQPLPT